MTKLEVSQDKSLDSGPRSVLRDKSPFWSMQNRFSDCNGSPFPTPLVLRDDMQTPGTMYASHTGSTMSRKRVRTRKQFVYPVLRPIENKLQQVEPSDDSSPMLPSSSPKRANLGADHIKRSPPSEESKCQTRSPDLLDGGALSKSNSDEKRAAMSLTHWLKPSSRDNENQGSPVFTAASGMDADVENPTPRFPKAWDGNGIPNTTTKYKEDQKVSWHATPFEERLLRVLSDEQPIAPRKLIRGDLFLVEEET
uniref:Protein JASON n=1 Tax=Aegilops tauschii subsp. strangulata TaxID=200361 RepID=A0A453SYS6_AEGTS